MAVHSRKLLVLAMLCWVAPASARQAPPQPQPHHDSACPQARAKAAAAQAAAARSADASFERGPFGGRGPAAELMP